MRNILTTTALALVLTTGAYAASHTGAMLMNTDGESVAMPAERSTMLQTDPGYTVEGYEAYTDPLTIADVDDAPLFSTISGEEIGEVETVLTENDAIQYLILDIGGFLGIGEKTIAITPDEVMAMRNPGLGDTRIYINATEEQLEEFPDYNSTAAEAMENALGTDDPNAVTEEQLTGDTMSDGAVITEDTQGAALTEEPVVGDTETMMAADESAKPMTDTAMTDTGADTAVVVVGGDEATTEQPLETAQTDTTVLGTDAVTPTDTDNMVTTDGAMVTENGASPFTRRDGTMVREPAFGTTAFEADPNYTVDGYEAYQGDYRTLLDEGGIEEAKLFSAVTGEEIGEVEDAIEENGQVVALVLDIGGFLGLGEHTITVAPDQVSYARDPGLLADVRVYINATKEQLEEVPSYNADLQGLQ